LKAPNAKEINLLFAHNDDMALGAIQAMEEAGIKPGATCVHPNTGRDFVALSLKMAQHSWLKYSPNASYKERLLYSPFSSL
jgi:hypothetical protein